MTVNVSKPALNVREKLAELDKPTGIAGEAMLRAETPQEQFQLIGAGRRNLLINGDMRIAQRGTSTTGVGSAGYYACDRWVYDGSSSAVFTMEQSTDAPAGFGNSFKVTTTTADGTLDAAQWGAIQQRLEGQDVQQLGFNTSNPQMFTVSFWVKSSVAGGYAFGLYYDDGSSTSVRYTGKPYTIDADNTWEYKTITFNAPTGDNKIANDNTVGLRLYFCLSAGSDYTGGTAGAWGSNANWFVGQTANIDGTLNATFQITGVQLELGKVATPFEHRSYGEELALCQRYYYRVKSTGAFSLLSSCYVNSSTVAKANFEFPVPMRTAPTGIEQTGTAGDYLVNIAGSNTTCNSVPTYNNASVKIGQVNVNVASGLTAGQAGIFLASDSDGYIGFTGAEL